MGAYDRSDRRTFLKRTLMAGAALSVPAPVKALGLENFHKLNILHTNDVHSHVDPFPADHKRYPGQGGAAARAAIIQSVRDREEHVLVLDAGDIFQGTPYFNFFGGELEFRLMNEMRYDAATIGNHDFDGGINGLARQLKKGYFPMLNCNYDVRDTPLEGHVVPHRVFHKGKLKIGITGAGVELDGLVPPALYTGVKYEDPVKNVNETARHLKHDLGCDYVIVLSHLGYRYESTRISDVRLAGESTDIDLIIGGHTHTFMDRPEFVKNARGVPVMINQVGWAGVLIGKLEVYFHKKRKKKWTYAETVIVDKKSSPN